jgi:antagonist of KipI
MSVIVERAGFLTTVQDLGRAGHRQSGVSVGGALDSNALKVANLLVGNEPEAAGLEVSLGNVRLRFGDDRLIAWCGGAFEVRNGEKEILPGHAALLREGQELRMTAAAKGARAWFAISGGIDVAPVLGSRSTDLRSGFGGFKGRALRDGDILDLLGESQIAARVRKKLPASGIANWSAPQEWANTAPAHPYLRIVIGADQLRFEVNARDAFVHETFTVAQDSDRMGVRLLGPGLMRLEQRDLLSEAVAPGTIQVPPSGQPILLLGDCQTIGGYPKIAHVITVDLAAAAQLVPGDEVRFAEVSLADAHQLLIQRERELARFRVGLSLQTA